MFDKLFRVADLGALGSEVANEGHRNAYEYQVADEMLDALVKAGALVAVEPTGHQHQWLPWLTLPNGSSWTQCVPCGEQFQYDHEGSMPVPKEYDDG